MSITMKNKKHGFTLIELLIVISIIAILAALAIFGIGDVFAKARNTQRRSDVKQYQEALEVWANSNDGLYPVRTSVVVDGGVDADSVLCGDLGLGSKCPSDPVTTQEYKYLSSDGSGINYTGNACTNAGNTCAAQYAVWAILEEDSTTYFVVCYNGRAGTTTSEPTLASCTNLQ